MGGVPSYMEFPIVWEGGLCSIWVSPFYREGAVPHMGVSVLYGCPHSIGCGGGSMHHVGGPILYGVVHPMGRVYGVYGVPHPWGWGGSVPYRGCPTLWGVHALCRGPHPPGGGSMYSLGVPIL